MLIVHVHVHVQPEFVDEFRAATMENARNSINEPGVARFDVLQMNDAPERFVFTEVYRSEDAAAQHKETPHYQKWRDTVAAMMAEPRKSERYSNVFPADDRW